MTNLFVMIHLIFINFLNDERDGINVIHFSINMF